MDEKGSVNCPFIAIHSRSSLHVLIAERIPIGIRLFEID
jgi:hypothetical protein